MEEYKEYLRKFRTAILILGVSLACFIFLMMRLVPQIQSISTIQKTTRSQEESLADMERRLETLKKNAVEKSLEQNNFAKAFFKPISQSSDTESVIADEFAEILQLMREDRIKVRSIKYDYDPQDDNFVKFASGKYHVCRVTSDMIANYADFENFLRDIYKHEHFLEISKFEIVPYQKNKRILLINLQLKLYAQRNNPLPTSPVQPDMSAGGGEEMPVDNVNTHNGDMTIE